ncbi:mitochondrial carrier [Gloeophyllum trabeum ATCC 11539]|uniref:Mitochondrial carrier n=1 Tax=Gloeophyllum trabeum (strain ATCC 11539 / FP-39264 / Madison 617) TaxID=670483 RepID=S7RGT3_GLOTA|nr:mitochondrial carrier [Gloeophyllum trabeum ATCC 11539]EPQ53425.1 mitochondrial carrier [Gloeophyllum trabeum ATCC 11539]
MDSSSPTVRALKDIAFGSAAGIASKFLEHPFDLCKVRLQAQVLDQHARFSGPIDCLTQTWKNEGIRGLYRGLPAPIVGAMVENASLFLSYSELQHLIRRFNHLPASQDLSVPQLALAGAGAGGITSFLLTPIELVKCKMQVQMLVGSPLAPSPSTVAALASSTHPASAPPPAPAPLPSRAHLPGPLGVLTNVVRTTGVRGLWLGHTGTFIRETGGSGAWFATKEAVAAFLVARDPPSRAAPRRTKKELRPWESALAGACAGGMYNLAFFPADTVKSTLQTEGELRPGVERGKASFFGTFMEMWRKQGLRGLYAGCGITIARSIPSSAVIFLIYDGLSRRFG